MTDPAPAQPEGADALVLRALTGDRAAFEQLVGKFERPAWALARRIVGNREVAVELVQEAFLKVHMHREDFRAGQRFEPWFYRILANLCLNAARRHKHEERPYDPGLLGLSGTTGDVQPDRVAERRERDAWLARCFDELPPRYRAALALRVHSGLSVDQVAAILGCPEGTVKTLLFRAREILRIRSEAWESGTAGRGANR